MGDVEGNQDQANNSGPEEGDVQEPTQDQEAGNQTEGNNTSGLSAALRKELRGDERLKFGNASELAEAYLKQVDSMQNAVLIPGEDADEEAVKAYREKLGIPSDMKGYTFETDLPEGVDAGYDDWIRKVAFENNLTAKQAVQLRDSIIERFTADVQSQQARIKEAAAALKKQWGGEYGKNLKIAQHVVKKFASEDFKRFLDSSGLGDHPQMVEMMYTFGNMISEDTLIDGAIDRSTQDKPTGMQSIYGDYMQERYPDKAE